MIMNYKKLYFLLTLFCFSFCKAQVNKQSAEDGINKKFFLLNSKNFEKVFKGKKPKWYEDYYLGTTTFIFNTAKSEVLELIAAEGWGEYNFIAFNLYTIPPSFSKKGIVLSDIDSFQSNNGFYLNMLYKKDSKLFKSYKKRIIDGCNFVLFKEIDLGMKYFQKLYFKNNKLYRIYFGYDNP